RHTRFSRDWSSDVCSSDLFYNGLNTCATLRCWYWKVEQRQFYVVEYRQFLNQIETLKNKTDVLFAQLAELTFGVMSDIFIVKKEIGRASCRERVWGEWCAG